MNCIVVGDVDDSPPSQVAESAVTETKSGLADDHPNDVHGTQLLSKVGMENDQRPVENASTEASVDAEARRADETIVGDMSAAEKGNINDNNGILQSTHTQSDVTLQKDQSFDESYGVAADAEDKVQHSDETVASGGGTESSVQSNSFDAGMKTHDADGSKCVPGLTDSSERCVGNEIEGKALPSENSVSVDTVSDKADLETEAEKAVREVEDHSTKQADEEGLSREESSGVDSETDDKNILLPNSVEETADADVAGVNDYKQLGLHVNSTEIDSLSQEAAEDSMYFNGEENVTDIEQEFDVTRKTEDSVKDFDSKHDTDKVAVEVNSDDVQTEVLMQEAEYKEKITVSDQVSDNKELEMTDAVGSEVKETDEVGHNVDHSTVVQPEGDSYQSEVREQNVISDETVVGDQHQSSSGAWDVLNLFYLCSNTICSTLEFFIDKVSIFGSDCRVTPTLTEFYL